MAFSTDPSVPGESSGQEATRRRASYDYSLILATVAVLFAISAICIWAMFYFKWAEVQQMTPALKGQYMAAMNRVMAPFAVALIVLLGICVPKRLLPVRLLNWVGGGLLLVFAAVAAFRGIVDGLLVVLVASLTLQLVVLVLAAAGSGWLHFTRSGYWLRLGSSLIHLGIVLFLLDLFFFRHQLLHLLLFWVTTIATVAGMLFSFYAENVVRLFGGGREN